MIFVSGTIHFRCAYRKIVRMAVSIEKGIQSTQKVCTTVDSLSVRALAKDAAGHSSERCEGHIEKSPARSSTS